MKVYRTKEDGFLLVVFLEQTQGVVFLLDNWKTGIKDFEQFKGGLKGLKRRLGMTSLEFHKISPEEGLKFVKQGLEIADRLDQPIPSNVRRWLLTHNIDAITLHGSLYKCFNCEEGNLDQDDVDEILAIARQELNQDIVGTEEEEQYFYICEKCKGEMHKAHSD